MSLFRGIAQVVLGDQALTKYPAGFQAIGQGYISTRLPIPISFVLFLVLAALFGVRAAPHSDRPHAFTPSAPIPTAALFSGIPVKRIRFWLFVLMGLMAGLAAVLLTGRIGSTRPNIALGFELEVVTMVVLGGVSIAGGVGGILGVTLAVFVLGLTTFGLSLVNVPGIVISILNGALLIVSIARADLVARGAAEEDLTCNAKPSRCSSIRAAPPNTADATTRYGRNSQRCCRRRAFPTIRSISIPRRTSCSPISSGETIITWTRCPPIP